MSAQFSVHPEELQAGSGKVLGLADTAKSVTSDLTATLGSMAGAAGHPDIVAALAELGAAAMKATMDTAAALEHVGTGVQAAAKNYDAFDTQAAQQIQNHAKGAS